MNPKVSIITVVYNGVQFLERAIQSVLKQTYANIEYIIVDGGSTDGSQDIIKKYDSKIKKWVSEKDGGIFEAMNKGILMARGDLIGILNADDWYENDAVEKIVAAYTSSPEGDIFHGLLCFREQNEDIQYISGHTSNYFSKGIEHPTCFIKREIYQKCGAFDSKFRSAGDYELLLRFKKLGLDFVFVDKVIANFRSGGQSTSLKGAIETINLNYKYGFISPLKRLVLIAYWRLKSI